VHLTIIKQHANSAWYKTNPKKYGVCFIMFITVWNCFIRLCFTVNQWLVIGNASPHSLKFFANPLQQLFHQTFLMLKLFKPGACRPKAGAHLVSWNYFCPRCLYACVCVCPPPMLLITSGVIWCDIELLWLVKQVLGVSLSFIWQL